jgi:very-short-patch-repair endonuclease
MPIPFVGSEAVAAGTLRKHQLRTKYVALFPDVYVARNRVPTVWERAFAAWLWSHRSGVIGGLTAAALHRARYVEDSLPIELFSPNRHPPNGIVTHKGELATSEVLLCGGLPVTTPERTAFDLGRRPSLDDAVARLDALGNATGFRATEVLRLACERHAGARGTRQLREALTLYDSGAESPRETWLRLLVMRAGYPRPSTQIPVRSLDGRRRYYLDMGWEDIQLALEYDGDHHRHDPVQFAGDIVRSEDLDQLHWRRIRVAKRHAKADILRRLSVAWEASVHTDPEKRGIRDLTARSRPV